MLNKVILHGRLVRDPEMRQTAAGVPVCRFSVAVNRPFANKQTGERETDFIDVTAWRQSAEFVCRYFRKGQYICVDGELRNNDYEKDGVKHYAMIVMANNVAFGGDAQQTAQRPAAPQTVQYAAPQATPQKSPAEELLDLSGFEEVPF